jgi:hypothetical protein
MSRAAKSPSACIKEMHPSITILLQLYHPHEKHKHFSCYGQTNAA